MADDPRVSPAKSSSLLLFFAILAVIGGLAYLTYRSLFDLAFVGWDTYPTILSSRILGFRDFADTFTEELMDGKYTDGHFYRPVTNLVFALDHAIWGIEPKGYHLTDLAILIVNATLLFAVSRRLFGVRSVIAGSVAGLLFVLHPIQLEVFPVPPRRGDTLCLAFLLAALLVQRRPEEEVPAWRRKLDGVLVALFVFAAVGSKETGAIVAPLLFGLNFFWALGKGVVAAARHALVRCAPVIVAAFLYGGLRVAAVGGLGGHRESSLEGLASLPALVRPYLELVIYPQPYLSGELARWLVPLTAVALVLLAALLWVRAGTDEGRGRMRLRSGLLFLGFWLLSLLAISSLSGRLHVWYAMLFAAPYAVLIGLLVDRGVRAIRERRLAFGLPALTIPLLLCATHVRYSSLVHTYEEWDLATRGSNAFLERFRSGVEGARPGEVLVLDRMPVKLSIPGDRPSIKSTWILADYSIQAYGELIYPDRTVLVKKYTGGRLPRFQGGDAVHVYIYNGALKENLFE